MQSVGVPRIMLHRGPAWRPQARRVGARSRDGFSAPGSHVSCGAAALLRTCGRACTKSAYLFLALPLLLDVPRLANSAQRSAADTSNSTPTVGNLPGRGLLVSTFAGILGGGGTGSGFTHGSN